MDFLKITLTALLSAGALFVIAKCMEHKAEKRPATPYDLNLTVSAAHIGTEVIMDGRIMGENLSRAGRDEKWLVKQIKSQGYRHTDEIFLGIYRPEEDTLVLYPAD